MLKNKNLINKRAYTLVEILIAAGIFVVFSVGVFSLYRMGSQMYVSGSWRFNKQKEVERFFQVLKERVEQSSCPSRLVKNASGSLIVDTSDKTAFFSYTAPTNISGVGLNARTCLAEFLVAKPDLSASKINAKPGLLLYHVLTLVPGKEGLAELHLHVDTNPGNPYVVNKSFHGYRYPIQLGTLATGNYAGDPGKFGLAPAPYTYIIKDVASVNLSCGIVATGTVTLENNTVMQSPLFTLSVRFQNPKHEATSFDFQMRARIDSSVKLAPIGS